MGLKRIRTGNWMGKGRSVLALMVLLLVSAGSYWGQVWGPQSEALTETAVASVAYTGLPAQGHEVMTQIRQGGPFRFEKDGAVFGNREHLLPSQKRGYYREYTVPTPGLSHRGARRIVCGGPQPKHPDACYYTDDHYNSFRLIMR